MSFGYIPDYRGKSTLKDLYLRIFGYPYPPRRNEARLVFKLLEPAKGERILDLGCGDGVWCNDLARKGFDVIGLDISGIDLKQARDRAERLALRTKLVHGDAQELPFADGSFNKVFSICAMEHMRDDGRVLREAFRLLRPNGTLVVSVPTSVL